MLQLLVLTQPSKTNRQFNGLMRQEFRTLLQETSLGGIKKKEITECHIIYSVSN